MNGEEIITFLKTNKNELENFGISKIGLFGSYSKNKESQNSDIDILVEFKKGRKTFDNYMDLKFYLEDTLRKKVDLVMDQNIKEELKSEILRSVRYA